MILQRWFFCALTLVVPLCFSTLAEAQSSPARPAYVSAVDRDLKIENVAVLPFSDNVSNIYAEPLNRHLQERLKLDPRWQVRLAPNGLPASEETTERIQKIMKDLTADSVLSGRVLRGPGGLHLRLTLYAGSQGYPLLMEEVTEPRLFSIERMTQLLDEALARLRARLPYHGVVASRRGQQVTLNLGMNSGLRDGDVVDIIQILQINRHPKLRFMVSTEKEILGKAQVFKADEELSFANLTFEKEAGVVVPGQKVLAPRPIRYAVVGGMQSPDTSVFGENPQEWVPTPPPQFGRLQVMAGLSQYSQNSSFASGESLSGNNSLAPSLAFMAEGWLNREWWVGLNLRQSSFSVSNPNSNSTPGRLNLNVSRYDVSGGYNFLLGNDFFGPKLQTSLGISQFATRADSSTPLVFSDMRFGGMYLGLNFNTNLSEGSPWDLGAKMKYYFSPSATDSADSGSITSQSANEFAFTVAKQVRQNLRYLGELNFESYSADFDGSDNSRPDPIRANSHRATTLWLGIEYAF